MEQDKKSCICCGQIKTLDHFKMTRWGERVNVCTECATQKARDNKLRKKQEEETKKANEEAKKSERQKMLESYTPRELMNELARRGYTGELTYTMKIDITNF